MKINTQSFGNYNESNQFSAFVIILILTAVTLPGLSQWNQVGNNIDGSAIDDILGKSVSISHNGKIVAVGAPSYLEDHQGYVEVHEYDGSDWVQLGGTLNGEEVDDGFGYSVSLSANGTRLAVGAYKNDAGGAGDKGSVRVFEYSGGTWLQLGSDIDGEADDDWSGSAVSLSDDGTTVAIGAKFNDGTGNAAGHVRVYKYSAGTWSQLGGDIDGDAASDKFGLSVSLNEDGTILAAGSSLHNSGAGHVKIFQYSGGNWNQLGSDLEGTSNFQYFGQSVSLNSGGNIVAVGAPHSFGYGYVEMYEYTTGWNRIGDSIYTGIFVDKFGYSVSLDSSGSTVAIGAYMSGGTSEGRVSIYENNAGTWDQVQSDIVGSGGSFGAHISLNAAGDTVAVGMSGLTAGGNSRAGRVQIYTPTDPTPIRLIDFTAARIDQNVLITWKTASEINNDYFTLEHSSNGTDFSTIAFISGAGNSNSLRSYSYTDNAPGEGMNFYRLKQTDFDRNYKYSQVISVRLSEKEFEIRKIDHTANSRNVSFLVVCPQEKFTDIHVYNIEGRLVFQTGRLLQKGTNMLNFNSSEWRTGIYMISLSNNEYKRSLKFQIKR